MTAEELRKVSGGVIGHFTPKECVIDLAEDAFKGAVGSNIIGLKVPANKFIIGAYLKNLDDALAGAGATLAIAVGANTVLSAQALADVKGKGKAAIATAPAYVTAESDVKLVVGTAALTAGKLTVGVIYA
jgi:hypothetical protein